VVVDLLLVVLWAVACFVCKAISAGPCSAAANVAHELPEEDMGLLVQTLEAEDLVNDLSRLETLAASAGIHLGIVDEVEATLGELEASLAGVALHTAAGAQEAKDLYLDAVSHVCGPFDAASGLLATAAACAVAATLGQVLLLVAHHTTYTVWYHALVVPAAAAAHRERELGRAAPDQGSQGPGQYRQVPKTGR
jgi:hypothetical protein